MKQESVNRIKKLAASTFEETRDYHTDVYTCLMTIQDVMLTLNYIAERYGTKE